ncbi:MAG: bifunctional diguanylate cyclase/phosphodiesterase [Kineosporiaceae bacterium]|nr:bifunctional diguanylate cyclase/phosphodiesterase [Kineosporiaceae bacterium]MBK7621289.1 bifunctional diguanylate cyclase/phosphodiesterase [Kineosporiaceae bacterium]
MASDGLTWLASRQALSDALTDEASAGRDTPGGDGTGGWTSRIGLLLLDVDRFSDLVASLGPDGGQDVLAQIATRLRPALRPNQMLARLGGDEFAVVLPDADREAAERVAHALLAQLDAPIRVNMPTGPRDVQVAASVGVATCRLPREDPRELVHQASQAVRQAKRSGGGVSHVAPGEDQPTRLPPIGELRVALEQGDLEVYLQPQVDLRRGRLCGAEALARWRHPQDGVLLPASFLPLAAQTGLMRPIAAAVTELAVAAVAQWWDRGFRVPVSLNLTPSDLLDETLTARIPGCLKPYGLPTEALRIEITEDVFLADADLVAGVLHRWQEAGVHVALDDFGTGYSSLAYLRELPISELKLDRVFITDLARPRTTAIVRHTIAMAHELGMKVVAEGIEDADTAAVLTEMGCDIGQGTFFGAAMAVPEFLAHLAATTT